MLVEPIEQVEQALSEATARIAENYIRLPIAGGKRAIYREQLYCYELYHQLRCALGDHFEYSLGGEVNKSGHPRMIGPGVSGTKPDLLVHEPGQMSRNLLVLEVKPAVCRRPDKIAKDLQTLTGYRGPGEYKHAWYLLYGGDAADTVRFRQICHDLSQHPSEVPIDLQGILLFWHRDAATAATRIGWDLA